MNKSRERSKDKEKTKKESEAKASESGITYRVQFLSSPDKIDTKDARFRKLPTSVERVEDRERIHISTRSHELEGRSAEAAPCPPRTYRDAFIARYRGKTRL